jgi:hypothetical protein
MTSSGGHAAWSVDQLAKGQFFHAKLHEWGLLEVAARIEQVQGEALSWKLDKLGVSQTAWDMVIHRGIKPVLVFAHPQVLTDIPQAVGYYRMLSMVSQKSMAHIKLAPGDFADYERGAKMLSEAQATAVAEHLNGIISNGSMIAYSCSQVNPLRAAEGVVPVRIADEDSRRRHTLSPYA